MCYYVCFNIALYVIIQILITYIDKCRGDFQYLISLEFNYVCALCKYPTVTHPEVLCYEE